MSDVAAENKPAKVKKDPVFTPSWEPFHVCPRDQKPQPPRGIGTPEGVADRLRAAGFAELQAMHAFNWAADFFTDVPASLKSAWRGLAIAEERHLGWLLKRMQELGVDVKARTVSDWLWVSLATCTDPREFAHFMASAEERGRKAGLRFCEEMSKKDPVSAEIFGKIAEEEIEHIRLAEVYFPVEPKPLAPRTVSSSSDTSTTAGV